MAKPDPFTHTITCQRCGDEFQSKRSDTKYCKDRPGRHCRHDANREAKGHARRLDKKVRQRCVLCERSYWTDRPDISRYCSDKCRTRAAYLKRPNVKGMDADATDT